MRFLDSKDFIYWVESQAVNVPGKEQAHQTQSSTDLEANANDQPV